MGSINNSSGLGDALFTKTQRQVLGILYGNPERSYYANEIVRLAGIGSGTVLRELEKLAKAGLLTVAKIGNQKHYQANHHAPIFAELRGIVIKTFGVADVLREFLAKFAGKIEMAFVYGSVAKGTDQARSDVDLMIVSDDLSYPDVMGMVAEVETKLGRPVNPTLYGVAEFSRKIADDGGFLARVIEQPKIFLIGTQDDLVQPR